MLTGGTVLNARYRVEKVLGQGGMGAIYLATHLELDEQVAIKEMLLEGASPSTREACEQQFRVEARILNRLRHPNLPRVYDFFELNDRHYLVMDFIRGGTLEALQHKSSIPEELILRWARELCEVLSYLHCNNPPVIFRDLKPANIMLDADGTIRLIDFGIAKVFEPEAGAQTKTVLAGAASHGFSAPEQYGLGGTDARSDIYSLGATLYTLLTNALPPPSMELAAGIADLIPLSMLRPGLSPTTVSAIEWMMQVHRDMRPPDIAAVQEALGFTKPGASGAQESLPQQMRRVLREEFHHFFPLSEWQERGGVLETVLHGLQTRGRRMPMFSVVGEPGLGKSRLLTEIAAKVAEEYEVFPIAHGSPAAQQQPFGLLLPAIGAWVRRSGQDVLPVLKDKLDWQTLHEASEALPELKPLVRAHEPPPPRGAMEQSGSVLAALSLILEEASHEVPVLLLLDDMQWTDDATLRLLDTVRVGDLASKIGVVLAVEASGADHACRAFVNRWARKGDLVPVPLRCLSRAELGRYVQAVLPPIEGLDNQLDLLLERSHGNPLLLEEILRFMVVRRYISEKNGILSIVEFRGDTLPNTLDDAVRRRREHLPLETQALLGECSVAGVRFDLRTALKLTGESTSTLAEALARACETLFVVPGDRGVYEFTSDAARQVFYHSLPGEQRAQLHRKLAAMEVAHTGYHRQMAGDIDRSGELVVSSSTPTAPVIEVRVGDAFQLKNFKATVPLVARQIEDALDALGMLLRGARNLSMSWASGSTKQTSFGTAMGLVGRLLEESGTLSYVLAGDTFYVNKNRLPVDKAPPEFKSALSKHRISGFEFQPGVDERQMREFLDLLTASRDAVANWTNAFEQRRIKSIVVSEVIFIAVAEKDLFDPGKLRLSPEVVVKLAEAGRPVTSEQAGWDLDRIDDMLASGVGSGSLDVVQEQLETLRRMLAAIQKGTPDPDATPLEPPPDSALQETMVGLLDHGTVEELKSFLALANMAGAPLNKFLDSRPELLIPKLESPQEEERTLATMGLLKLGAEGRRRLIYYLRTSDHPTGRAAAVFVLTQSGTDASLLLAEEVLRCNNVEAGTRLLQAMQMAGMPWVEPLANLLQSPMGDMRKNALKILLECDRERAEKLDLLLPLLNAEDLAVVDDAVTYLGELGADEAVVPLTALIERLFSRKTPDAVQVEEHICHSLGRIGSVSALPLLKAVLVRKGFLVGSWESSVRAAAVYALAHLPGHEARELLQKQLSDGDANVSRTARFVLSRPATNAG